MCPANHEKNPERLTTCELIIAGARKAAPERSKQETGKRIDVQEPLQDPRHEAVAQFLAFPASSREFKSLTALAANKGVTRMTVHRWKKDPNVLRRAEWLSIQNRLVGDLTIRRQWRHIVEGQIKAAISGDTQAARFCSEHAWPKERQPQKEYPGRSLSELLEESEEQDIIVPPSFVKESLEERKEGGIGAWLVRLDTPRNTGSLNEPAALRNSDDRPADPKV